ncbi:MAG TPA: sugar-binding protein, partial [Fimbriimonadaceae bacterium]|nr:sugar-binding protein [Fimbriimonadaceae bacterium]
MIYPHPKGYVCYQGSPDLTGKMDDPAWQNAPWTDPFVDIEGDKKPKPPLETKVKMLWDDDYFYIGARLIEP